MKRILFFFLLLVNLQLTTDNGSLSIAFGEVSAQGMMEEQLDEVSVTGSAYTTCSQCGAQVLQSALSTHQTESCPERSLYCSHCQKSYKYYESHSCEGGGNQEETNCHSPNEDYRVDAGGFCNTCKRPITSCRCKESTGGRSGGSGSKPDNNKSKNGNINIGENIPLYSYFKSFSKSSLAQAVKSYMKGMKGVTKFSADKFTEALIAQMNDPSIVQQGKNGSCGAATIQKYICENYPDLYASMAIKLFTDGKFTDNIKIVSGSSLYNAKDIDLTKVDCNGSTYTSVDALMQSAIITWLNNQGLYNKVKNTIIGSDGGYNSTSGNPEDGGMVFSGIANFLNQCLGIGLSNIDTTKKNLNQDMLKNIDYSKYWVFGDVKMDQYNEKGSFIQGPGDHIVQITGVEKNGKIDYWSWGENNTTKSSNGFVGKIITIKK